MFKLHQIIFIHSQRKALEMGATFPGKTFVAVINPIPKGTPYLFYKGKNIEIGIYSV